MITVPERVARLMQRLLDQQHEAHIVGGCVRDQLLQREVSDYDITTSATPEEIIKVFSGFKVMDFGKEHGTVAIYYRDEVFEITTYRTEGRYSDGRRPDSVAFVTDLKQDLARRDFTINAMAADITGKIVDLYGGLKDLETGIIRAVGEPAARFAEDSLRILRAFRFALRFGFELEPGTGQAIRETNRLLDEHQITGERIATELDEILTHGGRAAEMLKEYGTLEVLLPMVETDGVLRDYEYAASQSADVNLAILLRRSYPEATKQQKKMMGQVFETIKGWGRYRESKVQQLLEQGRCPGSSWPELLRWIDRYTRPLRAKDQFELELEVTDLLDFATAVDHQDLKGLHHELVELYSRLMSELPVDGHDAKTLGYRGRQIAAVLNIWRYGAIYLRLERKEEFEDLLQLPLDEQQLRMTISGGHPTHAEEEDRYLQWLQKQFQLLE